MKALYARAPGEYGLMDRPKPVPASDEALVKVTRAALCHTDVIIRSGAPHVRYPVIPGHEFSGIVEEVGRAIDYVKPGDRVGIHTVLACGHCRSCRRGDQMGCENYDELGSKRDGGFAEYCTVPARHLYLLPDHVTLEEAALLECLANAVSVVRQSELRMGERVVVVGPGPIGLLAVQVARLANPSVLALVGTRDERLALGTKFGATHTINIKRAGALETIQDILGNKGADAALECAGTPSALELALKIIGWRGRIALEGVFDEHQTFPVSPYFLLARAASLKGINGWLTIDFASALELMSQGRVDVKPVITHAFRLEEWEAAFDMITKRKSEAIKVQFVFD